MGMNQTITVIPPGVPLTGHVSPPGSKSITNRAFVLAAVASSPSTIRNASCSPTPSSKVGDLPRNCS